MSRHLTPKNHARKLRRFGNIIRWECSKRFRVLYPAHEPNVRVIPPPPKREKPPPDCRILTDVEYMQKHGLALKEARRTPCTRPGPNPVWHDWKQEEYLYALTNSSRADRESSPEADRAAHDGEAKDWVSPLVRLPHELLDLTLSFLPKDAELNLRLSCPALYHRYGMQTGFYLLYNLRIDPDPGVRQRSRWTAKSWLQRPPGHRLSAGSLPCSVCGTSHPRPFLSEREATKRLSPRVCYGWTRPLRISPRHSVTLRHLLMAAHEGWKTARLTAIGPEPPLFFRRQLDNGSGRAYNARVPDNDNSSVPEDVTLPSAADEAISPNPSGPSVSAVTISWEEPIRHSHWSVAFPKTSPGYRIDYDVCFQLPKRPVDVLLQSSSHSADRVLRETPFEFCPHMGSDDSRVLEMAGALFWKSSHRPYGEGRVGCESCKTCLTLSLKLASSGEHVWKVCVRKYIGDLNSAMDPVWLAHLTYRATNTPIGGGRLKYIST
ncbi:MAG: hypothetical protein LQ346_006205 [Caloplaca aetnensis]|nr:MAG: hypothetical protein LQ346_006205 [Caloplaca aetnensis]